MNQYPLKGTGVALVTPFKSDGAVDYTTLERIIENCIDGGVDFLVSLGTTGEAITLSEKECREVFDFTLKVNRGRLPMVVGFFGGNNTNQLLKRIEKFNFDGFDYIMSSSPSYSKPSQEGIYQHFMKIEEASPLPIIIYNVPGRTASNMTANTIVRLANASKKFVAVKEASGDVGQAGDILKNKPDSLAVLSGDDALTIPLMSLGAAGVISVIANAFPFEFSEMVRSVNKGEYGFARHYHELLLDIHPHLYSEGNPCGIKAAMHILGLCENEVRLPLEPVSKETYQSLEQEIDKVSFVNKIA